MEKCLDFYSASKGESLEAWGGGMTRSVFHFQGRIPKAGVTLKRASVPAREDTWRLDCRAWGVLERTRAARATACRRGVCACVCPARVRRGRGGKAGPGEKARGRFWARDAERSRLGTSSDARAPSPRPAPPRILAAAPSGLIIPSVTSELALISFPRNYGWFHTSRSGSRSNSTCQS